MKKCSRIRDFYKKTSDERLEILQNFADLSPAIINDLKKSLLECDYVKRMSENVVAAFSLPYSIAPNFLINEKDYLVPMVTEEPSVVAGASRAAKLCRASGGFKASADKSIMIGQIHLLNVTDIQSTKCVIEKHKTELLEAANKKDPVLTSCGGGALDIFFRSLSNNILIIHLIVDVKDAMGANAVNTMVEVLAPKLEKLTGAKALMNIVSNLAIYRLARATAVWNAQEIGQDLIEKITLGSELAKNDIFRAVTHNKGIMNGVDAVTLATGNDFRANEAGAHGFACYQDTYQPLSTFEKDSSGNLVGKIELPVVVGIVGGATKVNPMAQISLKILRVQNASDLAQIIASVGLAQNFAAVSAIVENGIQQGHMKLHSQNIAFNAGVADEFVELVAQKMVDIGKISCTDAIKIYEKIKDGKSWK